MCTAILYEYLLEKQKHLYVIGFSKRLSSIWILVNEQLNDTGSLYQVDFKSSDIFLEEYRVRGLFIQTANRLFVWGGSVEAGHRVDSSFAHSCGR